MNLTEEALEEACAVLREYGDFKMLPTYLIVPGPINVKIREILARMAWKQYWRGYRMMKRQGLRML